MCLPPITVNAGSNPDQSGANRTSYNVAMTRMGVRFRGSLTSLLACLPPMLVNAVCLPCQLILVLISLGAVQIGPVKLLLWPEWEQGLGRSLASLLACSPPMLVKHTVQLCFRGPDFESDRQMQDARALQSLCAQNMVILIFFFFLLQTIYFMNLAQSLEMDAKTGKNPVFNFIFLLQ